MVAQELESVDSVGHAPNSQAHVAHSFLPDTAGIQTREMPAV